MQKIKRVAIAVNLHESYDRQIVASIARYAQERGHWSLYAEDDPSARLPNFSNWRGDGIIANLNNPQVARALAAAHIPVVGVGGAAPPDQLPPAQVYVATDNVAIGHMAADHLLERGFRRFAYYGIRNPHWPAWPTWRGQAFQERIRQAGYPCSIYMSRQHTAARWESLQAGLTRWLQTLETPVGLLACDDVRARHVLEACRRVGLRSPDDVAVLGVDNDELMCELALPPLSSILQGTSAIGYEAASHLDRLMSGWRGRPRWVVVSPVGVVTRRSTDVLAVEDPKVAEAMRYIREHVQQGLRVPDIANHVHLSRSSLDQHFLRVLGRTVHEEILRVQLARAQELITSTELPLKQVALRAGFSSVQYMTTAFRRELGHPPGQYRQRHHLLATRKHLMQSASVMASKNQ